MRFIVYFVFLTLFGCSSGQQKANTHTDTVKTVTGADSGGREDDATQTDFRQEFISLYQKLEVVDTTFSDGGRTYRVIFHHFCTMDNGLVVPAKYNFDTNKDFVTHNFASDLMMLSDKDTVFKKHITKSTFSSLLDTLDTPLKKYAALLYPTLSIKNDSVQIYYSISIPVTDVGIGIEIKFDNKGNYVIGQ